MFFDLDSLVDYYTTVILSRFENKKIFLGGWSYGAILTGLIAKKLIDNGKIVEKLEGAIKETPTSTSQAKCMQTMWHAQSFYSLSI